MLTNFFSKSKPITFLVVLGLFISLYFTAFLSGQIVRVNLEIMLLLFLTFVITIFINRKNNLSFDNSYVFLIFILLIGVFPSIIKSNTVIYSNLILLLFLRKIYSLQSTNKTFKKLFDAGFLLGISFLLEPFSLLFGVLIYLSIYLHQHLTFQKLIIPLIGFFIPVFLFFTYCLWYNEIDNFNILFDWFTSYDLSYYYNFKILIPILCISFIILIAIIIKTPRAMAIKNNFRRSWILVLLNFLCAATLVIILKNKNGSEFLYLLFPSAVIIANAIEIYENKWFSNVFIALFIIASFTICFL